MTGVTRETKSEHVQILRFADFSGGFLKICDVITNKVMTATLNMEVSNGEHYDDLKHTPREASTSIEVKLAIVKRGFQTLLNLIKSFFSGQWFVTPGHPKMAVDFALMRFRNMIRAVPTELTRRKTRFLNSFRIGSFQGPPCNIRGSFCNLGSEVTTIYDGCNKNYSFCNLNKI